MDDIYTPRRIVSEDAEDRAIAPIAVGVLDLCKAMHGFTPAQSIDNILHAAAACEGFGYGRYWLAEHHTPDAVLSCPELLIPLIAQSTRQIRVGLGGVLLAYQSVRRAAELAFALAAIAPGRIDFGVCRGPGVAHPAVAGELAFGSGHDLTPEGFRAKVRALVPYLLREPGPPGSTAPAPVHVSAPDIWLLGSSVQTFDLAVEISARLAITVLPEARRINESALLSQYEVWRLRYPRVRSVLAISVVCMDTQVQAEAQDRNLIGAGFLGANVVGDADCCAEQLLWLSTRYDIREFLVTSWVATPAERLRGYELLAQKVLPVSSARGVYA